MSTSVPAMNPWRPMTRPLDLKHLGKLAEELGEAQAAVARCIIQGLDEREPVTGKLNREWAEDELADVLANIELVTTHFALNRDRMGERQIRKMVQLASWHDMLTDEPWRPMSEAVKGGPPILALLKDPIPREGREDLTRWAGRQVVVRHEGLARDGFDIGWQMAAPVGAGGFPDDWFVGWAPLVERGRP